MAGDDFINSLGATDPSNPGSAPGGGASQAGSTADIQRNLVLNAIVAALQSVFPQATATMSSSATAGAATLPANPTAFLTIVVGSTSYKVPLYGA